MWFVYILRCNNDSFYTGVTTDVSRRFRQHQQGVGGNYTRAYPPVSVEYTETHASRSDALIREAAIKKLSRLQKQQLISGSMMTT